MSAPTPVPPGSLLNAVLPRGFTHLHVHSHFSLLAATPPVTALVARAAADGLDRLALTDSSALYGAVSFARACHAAGILPIVGMAVTVAPEGGHLSAAGVQPEADLLVLLARNPAGYRSLCRITSAIQGSAQREERAALGAPWALIAENRSGLICLTGGRAGLLDQAARRGDERAAANYLARLAGVFDEACAVGLDLPASLRLAARQGPAPASRGRPGERLDDRDLAALLRRQAERFGLRLAAVHPTYCLETAEERLLPVLDAMRCNATLAERQQASAMLTDVTWLSPVDMAARFAAAPDALAAAAELASACEPSLPDGRTVWPVLSLAPGQTAEAALAAEAAAGLQERFGADPVAAARLDRELVAVQQRGFAPLFLIVADLVRFARAHGVPVSTRGSVANSLVAYCLGITTVDPIANELLFERFLNPARTTLPDIDLDFCSRRRDEVLAYARERYGADHVALVATVSTLRPRSALRETAKVYGLDEEATERLVKLLPDAWHPDPRRRVASDPAAVLQEVRDERERQVIRDAYALLGQPDHLSIHPGGLVITPGPLTDIVPVQWAPKGFLVTQYDHDDVEAVGLPKIDLLGIRALTVLADAAELVRRWYDPGFDLTAIPLADETTGQMLAAGDTIGVFQCESTGAQRTLRQLRAHTVRDLAVANAFFKPGPATGGMAQSFVRRYRGQEAVEYLHPALEPILRSTRGVLLFQEQILRVARELAGLSWEEADHLRRGMSKFQPQEMQAMRDRFLAGCQRPAPAGPAFTAGQAQRLWEQVEAFAGYGFNQGHATAYADVSYRSAYLKAHWPAAFLAARLADWGGFHHQAVYIAEAQRLGIRVRPPHVNHSQERFTLELVDGTPVLWMGLGQVRDLRQASIEAIVRERSQAPFRTAADLVGRTALQRKELAHLASCGALDGLGASRAALLGEIDALERAGAGQLMFDFVQLERPPESPAERLAWELQILGQPISTSPLASMPAQAGDTALPALAQTGGRLVSVTGFRLPGWTGGAGFFLADGQTYVVAMPPRGQKAPPAWRVVQTTGRWLVDEWGGGAFYLEKL